MNSLQMLRDEHAVIERALDLLGQALDCVEAGQPIPDGFESWAIGFFRGFADHCHHAKEEEVLFPLLRQRGIPAEGGPIGVMLDEHEHGRDCVRRMENAIGETPNDAEFTAAAAEYASLLRQHIFKENNVLFEMAARCLTEEDDGRLSRRFRAIEEEHDGQTVHQRYEEEIADWEKAFQSLSEIAPVLA